MNSESLARVNVRGGRMGPNAITQVGRALHDLHGKVVEQLVFEHAGLDALLRHPPDRPVPAAEVARLHYSLAALLGEAKAAAVCRLAGRRTADYLLANRIPRAAQWLLKQLPPNIAARLLLNAIRRNAWTFLGNGCFIARQGQPIQISFIAVPLCNGPNVSEPSSAYYLATFESLFQTLVSSKVLIAHHPCRECSGEVCQFSLHL